MANFKSKVDRKIKRYLKSIAEDCKESKIYNSIHYCVTVDNKIVDIRLSDHLSSRSSPFINIIKITDELYHVWYSNGDKQVCNYDNIVDYIKSYILMYNKFAEYNNSLKNSITTLETELTKVHKSKLYKELQSTKSELDDAQANLDLLNAKLDKRNREISELNYQIDTQAKAIAKANKFFNYIQNNAPKL